MNPKTRRLSVGDALKKVAADFREEENDDEAEIAERRKTRVESAQVTKAPTISAEITSSWLRIFSEGVRNSQILVWAPSIPRIADHP